ncbi:MAG: modification methylase [Tenericutes bacterium]|nr:modification methylase [Mycoplasmatota bacterium]
MMDISYQEYNKKSDIHGTVLYPATMIAPAQKDILLQYVDTQMGTKIIDPFYGSGTSLYEVANISRKVQIYGCDINPFAKLITQTKLDGTSKNINNSINQLIKRLNSDMNFEIHHFENIEKWYRQDVIKTLSKIRAAINLEKDNLDRKFFWVIFSNLVRKFSNTRSSTYKLHMKPSDKIDNINSEKIEEHYIKSLQEGKKFYCNNYNYKELAKNDSIQYLDVFNDDFFDILITSPPYGDNHTTVPYGQFSSLVLFWINADDLDLEGWELENYSIIDSKSLGGHLRNKALTEEEYKIVEPYISNINEDKVKKVKSFMRDYFDFLYQAIRITSGHLILTLGNRTVDKILIDLTRITKDVFNIKGLEFINEYSREIQRKRTPRVIKVDNTEISSMNNEYVIVYKKTKDRLKVY